MSSVYQPPEPPPDPGAAAAVRPAPSWLASARRLRVFVRGLATLAANGKARIGLAILGLFALVAVIAPLIVPYSPSRADFQASQGPSGAHLLGTTGSGQDVLSQLLYGTRVSLLVALAAGAAATAIAIVVGMIAGYLRGVVDEFLGFVTNLALVIPALPLMIVLAAYLPNKGVGVIILVVVVTGWATGARVMRSQTQTLRNRDFVASALFSGERLPRIVFREILPNMTSLIAASFFAAATAAVLGEAGLEFLGLGNPNTISWGTMLYWAQNGNALLTGQWVEIFAPGLCVALLATSLSLVNFGVDALSNPRLREA
ncbi:MAG TPA: ABC transporter permease [Gaiellaceae bacterium]